MKSRNSTELTSQELQEQEKYNNDTVINYNINFLKSISQWDKEHLKYHNRLNSFNKRQSADFVKNYSKQVNELNFLKDIRKNITQVDALKLKTKRVFNNIPFKKSQYDRIYESIDESNKLIFINNLSITKNNFNFQVFKQKLNDNMLVSDFACKYYKDIIEYNSMQINLDTIVTFDRSKYESIIKERLTKEENIFKEVNKFKETVLNLQKEKDAESQNINNEMNQLQSSKQTIIANINLFTSKLNSLTSKNHVINNKKMKFHTVKLKNEDKIKNFEKKGQSEKEVETIKINDLSKEI